MCFVVHRERGTASHQAHTAGDQQDAGPSPRADRFMQKETREKCRDYVAKGAGGKDECEVSPGESGEVGVEKAGKTGYADDDPGINERGEDVGPVAEVNLARSEERRVGKEGRYRWGQYH